MEPEDRGGPGDGPIPAGDWTPEQFRQAGHQTIEWIARYLERIESFPVLAQVRPGEIRSRIPEMPPSKGEPFEDLLEDLDQVVVPGVTHWNHPGFFAYFGITASGPGILGEVVSAAFNTNGMLWRSSPSTTEVEQRVLGWLLELLHLPRDWFGILTDTASVSSLLALAAAREAVPGNRIREEGLAAPGAPRLRVYFSEETHSSIEKAVITLGLGQAGAVKIGTDAEFRMDPRALRERIRADRAAGWNPCAVVATLGTTSTTSVDPIPELAAICREENLWLHVDAAYAGSAAVLPEKREWFAGCDQADSYVVNPHKWLFVPIDASALYTRRPEMLRRAFQLVPDYLQTDDAGGAVNLMDYSIQMGRRFRAIKLWWVLRTFGTEGIRRRIAEHCRLAQLFADRVDADPRFERMAPVPFSTVCFRGQWDGLSDERTDRENQALLDRVNATGKVFLSHTWLRGRFVLRLAIGNLRTQERHVLLAWDLLRELQDD